MIKISIIIPIYQAERYINRCLTSLLMQNFSDYEIICVDDGSTDKSKDVIQHISIAHSEIKYFYQTNQGVSAARNKGLCESRGKYIMFVDADDWIKKNSLRKLYRKAEYYNADILVFGGRTDFPFSTPEWIREAFFSKTNLNITNSLQALYNEPGARPSVCNKLFKRELLGDSCFPQHIRISEDLAFLFTIFPKSSKTIFIGDVIYYYRTGNELSAMHLSQGELCFVFYNHLKSVEYILSQWNKSGLLLSERDNLQKWMLSFLDYIYIQLEEQQQENFKPVIQGIVQALGVPSEEFLEKLSRKKQASERLTLSKISKSIAYQFQRYGMIRGMESAISKLHIRLGEKLW